jgi:hypothetical protein
MIPRAAWQYRKLEENRRLAWLSADVQGLAAAAYANPRESVGTLDPDRLAVLADALEEAGCTDADILGHLCGPGIHVRG